MAARKTTGCVYRRATGATALARLGAPTADELGFAKALGVAEIGGTTVVVLEQDASAGAVSTVVLRASTDQLLDDLERAIDDGVNTYKVPSTHGDSLQLTHGGHCMRAPLQGIEQEMSSLPVLLCGLQHVHGNCTCQWLLSLAAEHDQKGRLGGRAPGLRGAQRRFCARTPGRWQPAVG